MNSTPYYSVRGLLAGRELGRVQDQDFQLVINESPLDASAWVLTLFDVGGRFLRVDVVPSEPVIDCESLFRLAKSQPGL